MLTCPGHQGFDISSSSRLRFAGSDDFWICPVNDDGVWNLYTAALPGQTKCIPVSVQIQSECSQMRPIQRPQQPDIDIDITGVIMPVQRPQRPCTIGGACAKPAPTHTEHHTEKHTQVLIETECLTETQCLTETETECLTETETQVKLRTKTAVQRLTETEIEHHTSTERLTKTQRLTEHHTDVMTETLTDVRTETETETEVFTEVHTELLTEVLTQTQRLTETEVQTSTQKLTETALLTRTETALLTRTETALLTSTETALLTATRTALLTSTRTALITSIACLTETERVTEHHSTTHMATILPQPGCDCKINDNQCRQQCTVQEAVPAVPSTTVATITSFRHIPCHQCRSQHGCMATCTQVSTKTETAVVWKPCVERCRGDWECIRGCNRPRPTCHSGNCGNWDDYDGYSDEEWRFERPINYDGYWSESEDEDCHHDNHHNHHHHHGREEEHELYKRSEVPAEPERLDGAAVYGLPGESVEEVAAEISSVPEQVAAELVTEAQQQQQQVAAPTRVARSSQPIANVVRVIVKRDEDALAEEAEEEALQDIFEEDEKFISLKKRFSVCGCNSGPGGPDDEDFGGARPGFGDGGPQGGPPHSPPHRPHHPHHPSHRLEGIQQVGPIGSRPVGGVIGEGHFRDYRIFDNYRFGHCNLGGQRPPAHEHPCEQQDQVGGGGRHHHWGAFRRERAGFCHESNAYEECRLACKDLYASCKEKCRQHVFPCGRPAQ
jgi:hypothetical protein